MKKSTPKGVGLKKETKGGKHYILLQFTIGRKRTAKACNCTFTDDGLRNAVLKAQKVAEALKKFSAESEFMAWYDREILEKNVIKNDLITFGEAIKRVEDNFWRSKSRTGMKRDKNNPSHLASWAETYHRYYKWLPTDKVINLPDIMAVINRYEEGTKSYGDCVSVMRKLVRTAENKVCVEKLDKLDINQTEFSDTLQSIDIDAFLAMRDKVLGITEELSNNADLDSRKDWMWVLSMQVVYGLRIHEVFAVLNLHKPFTTKDGVVIPALNDPTDTNNIIVIGWKNPDLDTTTKTGYRLSAPINHPRYPDLVKHLDIKAARRPKNKPREGSSAETKAQFYSHTARVKLKKWGVDLTQTHALRHLANMNGRMSSTNPTALAKNLGHSITMNEDTYTKRVATKTMMDLLLDSEQQALPLQGAVEAALRILQSNTSRQVREKFISLLAAIYHKSEEQIEELLR